MKTKMGLSTFEKQVLCYAAMAPSGHNAQPWLIKVFDKGKWQLQIAPDRRLPQVDPKDRESLLSLGAFLDNLLYSAHAFGLEFDYSVHSSGSKVDLFEKIRQKLTINLDPIQNRRTLRKGFLRKKLLTEDLNFLFNHNKDSFLYFPFDSTESKRIAELVYEANQTQIYRDEAQKELSQWLRWKTNKATLHQDGLTPESLEIRGLPRFWVKTFYNSSTVLTPFFRKTSSNLVRDQVNEGAGWILLMAHSENPQDLIHSGRTFQSMAVKGGERNIGIHPMSQVLQEVAFARRLSEDLKLNKPIQFVLRVGYVKHYLPPVSPRRSVDSFVQFDHG